MSERHTFFNKKTRVAHIWHCNVIRLAFVVRNSYRCHIVLFLCVPPASCISLRVRAKVMICIWLYKHQQSGVVVVVVILIANTIY